MNVICEHPAPGTSTIFFGATGRALRVRCDTLGHRLVVSDDDGRVLKVFGQHGRRPGCLDTPIDVVCVRPEFAGERLPLDSADALWLAVADYGNRRVQIVDLDGTIVGEVQVEAADGTPWTPTGLHWRSPVLEIEGIEGAKTAVHLSAALLAGGTPMAGRGRVVPGSEAWH
jgi:hypothetical protein